LTPIINNRFLAAAALWKGCPSNKQSYEQALTIGMQAAIRVKIQEHQRQAIEARIRKLQVDEERAQKKISDAEREAAFVAKMQEDKEQGYMMK